jgi:Ca2+-dependent lipid-binding protein
MAATKRKSTGRRYGKAAGKSVERAMRKRNEGTLKSGAGDHPEVESREQAIAIGLNEAREAGAKVPRKRSSTKKSGAKTSGARKAAAKKGGRKTAAKKRARKTTARKGARTRAASG